MSINNVTRRSFLKAAGAFAALGPLARLRAADKRREPLPVAAVVTEYRDNSHADVIVGKVLNGYNQKGGEGPALKLVGMYVDQTPKGDMSKDLSEQYKFRLAKTIDEALTLGTDKLQVAGVLSIGEHGTYPQTPDTKQVMYPRRRFFDGIADCFQRVGKVAPVFSDKHLSYRWADAKHMVERAAELKFPLMAGSSISTTWRRPAISLPLGCELERAFAVGYGGPESYGFHALEGLQCMVERRAGGETGVAAVRALMGDEIQKARDKGDWSEELFAAALHTMPGKPSSDLSKLAKSAVFYQIEYRDGLRATVAIANGISSQFAFAGKLKGKPEPVATWYELEEDKPFGHFAHQLRAIEHMIHTGRPAYPAERTLLTTGVLDALMHSLAEEGKRRETPELTVKYAPTDWTFANREG